MSERMGPVVDFSRSLRQETAASNHWALNMAYACVPDSDPALVLVPCHVSKKLKIKKVIMWLVCAERISGYFPPQIA